MPFPHYSQERWQNIQTIASTLNPSERTFRRGRQSLLKIPWHANTLSFCRSTKQSSKHALFPLCLTDNIFLRTTFKKVLEYTQQPPKQRDTRQRWATAQQHAFDNVNQLREMLAAFESLHEIKEWWTPDSAQ